MPRGSKPGERRGGRKKGTPNKTTASVRAALEQAFTKMGGVKALVKWGKSEPAEFYKIWSKMLPQEVKNQVSGKVSLEELVAGTKPEGEQ